MSNTSLEFKKVLSVPAVPTTPNTYFLVQTGAGKFDSYVSSSDGTSLFAAPSYQAIVDAASTAQTAAVAAAATYTDTKVTKAVGDAVTSLSAAIGGKLQVFPTYADLTTYATANAGVSFLALVTVATGDTTVASGSATYVVNAADASVTKIAEHESMDMIITWANIVGKPNSTPADIDLAVSRMHTHANLAVLDKLSDIGGALAYDGALVNPSNLTTAAW